MAEKSVNEFVKALVNSDQELTVWPSDFSKQPEHYVSKDEQNRPESEEE